MRRYCRIRSFLLAGLLAFALPPSTARAVSISLVPDGSTAIEIGETVTVGVFLVLDVADQLAGIDAVTFQLESGGGLVTVAASTTGSVFIHPPSIVNTFTVLPHPADFIAFAQYGAVVNTAEALLASLTLTGAMEGSYDLVALRSPGLMPFITSPDGVNRYDFGSDETLRITVCDGACPIASPTSPPPQTIAPEYEIYSYNWWKLKRQSETTLTIISTTDTVFPDAGSVAAVPEPHTFTLLCLALTGLMILRSPRRERSKRSPGS